MTMKRTKHINQDAFRKSWRSYRLAPVAIAVSAVFMLSACEESDETVSLYTNAQDCSQANPSQAEQCTLAYNNALQEAAKTAPKYATKEDCIAEFGEAMCTQAPAQASFSSTAGNGEQTAQAQSSSGSMWMPLMMGYMMGRMMGGSAPSQPLLALKIQLAQLMANLSMLQVKAMVLLLQVGVLSAYQKQQWHLSHQPLPPSLVVALATR